MARWKRSWYAEGLRFECSQCGGCCRGQGYVWVRRQERAALAEYLGLELDEFDGRHTRQVDGRRCLVDRGSGDCVFWQDGCLVYAARPKQCRTFPFWREILRTRESWIIAALGCPGMDKGRHYPPAEIEALSLGKGSTEDGGRESESSGD